MASGTGGRLPEDLQAGKAAIRREVRRVRDAIPPADRVEMAKRVEERLFSLPAILDAKTVMVFSSFGSEVPTDDIIGRLFAQDRRVLLPYIDGADMSAAEVRTGETFVGTSYGPKEPAERVPVDPREIDVVVAPGVAFDRSGHRLGYGGGNYDRFLARLRPGATRVGIAFSVQIVDSLPHGEGDQPMDYVVTDQEIISA